MKHLSIITLAASLTFTSCAAEKDPKPTVATPKVAAVDAKAMDGAWRPIAAVLGGVRLPDAALQAITLKVNGTNYEVTVTGEKEPDRGTCTLDPNTTPKRMTIKSTSGPNQGKTFLAIYEMKSAGALRVCYDLSGTDFPKEFKAPKDTAHYLVGYRRPKD
jgi:uncharacterized protein (TIGR03067 family)